MTDTAADAANRTPANETAGLEATDIGLLIFASIDRIREQIRLEQACQRTAAPRMPTAR